MNTNIRELCLSENDHMLWLGDYNCHHPLWDEDHNSHLFTAAALEAAGKVLELVADYGMIQILPKDIPMLQLLSMRNWTCPDNVFCTEHTSELLVSCNMAPEKQGPKTDHLPILMVLNMSTPASDESPSWNYHSIDWDKFCPALETSLTNLSGPPRIIETAEEFQRAACNLDEALCNAVETTIPKTCPPTPTRNDGGQRI